MALKVFIIAGEASGDILGARLMHAMREQYNGDVEFSGVGGAAMGVQGLDSLFPMQDLSVMGIAEVLPRLPKILRRIAQTVEAVGEQKPDLFISIDSPDFCFRVAKAVRTKLATPPKMVHYVAPTVWAWRPERAKKVAKLYDGIMCLFPFEPPYFEREGMKAAFVGHPVMESGLTYANDSAFRVHHNIPANATVMGLLFGSRMGELNRMGPVLRAAARVVAKDDPALHIVSPTLPHLKREVRNLLQKMPCHVHIIDDTAEKYESFRAMNFALATSGTVGLELGVADTPHIIAYRMSPVTWRMIRNKLKVKYAHLVNILLDRPVVPEFIQQNCQPEPMGADLLALKRDGGLALQQRKDFTRVRELISVDDDTTPSRAAARFVLDILK